LFIITIRKRLFRDQFLATKEIVTNCDQNSHHIRVWLLNNYKIEVIIEFSDQLSQIIGI